MKLSKNLLIKFFFTGIVLFLSAAGIWGQERFHEELLKPFTYRSLGPYRAGSWITDFAVPEFPLKAHLYTFYVGTRSGGVWKTVNNGTTFEPIFDGHDRLAIGALALAPSNPDILWVGTGESYNCRSSYSGDGIYKSTDAGETWQNMGLEDSHHIARIVIHPKNPDIVYVAAMGHLYTPNEQRGVFKTTNGGKSWEKVLYINDKIGVIDLVMNRDNPEILYAATYEKYRYPWHFEAGGPGSGIYKTTDGGKTWMRLGGGLPSGKIGRIGIDIYRKNPDILYAVIENLNLREPVTSQASEGGSRERSNQPREIAGEVYRTQDAGKTWTKMNRPEDDLSGKAAYSFNQIRINPANEQNIFVTCVYVANSEDGGKTWTGLRRSNDQLFRRAFGDIRTMWIDPENPERIFMGSDGGVNISYDGGKTCDHYTNLPLGEFYAIGVDMEYPYNVYGGLQDHESWKGPSNNWSGRITIADWVTVGNGDGMYNQIDPTTSRWLYNTSQFGGHYRVDQKLGTRVNIVPRRDSDKEPYRFNWCPPIQISPHNSQIIYAGAQILLRSLNRGDRWEEISPDLTTNDAVKIAGQGHIQYCTITTISESSVTPGVIWIGTDDGKVWLTRNHGASWTELTEAIANVGGPREYWVSRVFASSHQEGTAYVSKTGYRRDDFKPYLYKTTDYGVTWHSIVEGLPEMPINVVYEDRKNPELLFVGTDGGVHVSINGGDKWVQLRNNMPSVPVHDLVIHPRENDLVVGTYGRGLYITDISPLQEINETMLDEEVYLFKIEPKSQWTTRTFGGNYHLYGDRYCVTQNEPQGIFINYYLKSTSLSEVEIVVTDSSGEMVATLSGENKPGISSVLWNMQNRPERGRQVRTRGARRQISPGEYTVILKVGDKELKQKALIKQSLRWPVGIVSDNM